LETRHGQSIPLTLKCLGKRKTVAGPRIVYEVLLREGMLHRKDPLVRVRKGSLRKIVDGQSMTLLTSFEKTRGQASRARKGTIAHLLVSVLMITSVDATMTGTENATGESVTTTSGDPIGTVNGIIRGVIQSAERTLAILLVLGKLQELTMQEMLESRERLSVLRETIYDVRSLLVVSAFALLEIGRRLKEDGKETGLGIGSVAGVEVLHLETAGLRILPGRETTRIFPAVVPILHHH